MALNSLGLGFLFTATDLASGVMDTVGKNLKSLEEQTGQSIGNIDEMTKKLGAGLVATAVGVGGLKASFDVAGKAASFEAALAAVGAVSNASAEELKLLEQAAIKAGKETQFSPTEAVQGLNELAQAGYDVRESIELLNPVLGLAAGSLGDLSPADAAGLASQGLKAFGIDATLAGRAVDQLLQSANAFAVKPKDLALGLGTMSSGAQTLNQSLTETVITFGLVKNIIPGTERAATSVKVAMERLANPKVQAQLKAQHVAVLDANGGYREFLDIIKDLLPQMQKMTDGEKGAFLMKVFGTEGLAGVNALFAQFGAGIKGADGTIRKGADAIDYLRSQFSKANGVADEFSKKTLNTFEGSKKLLMGSMETLAIEIGKPFMEVWRPVIESFTTGVNKLIEIIDGMSPSTKAFFAKVIVGALALVALAGGVLLVGAAAPIIMGGIGLLTTAVIGLGVAAAATLVAMWPLTLLAALLGLALYGLSKTTGGLSAAWDSFMEGFDTADIWHELQWAAAAFNDMMNKLQKQLGGTGGQMDWLKGILKAVGFIIGLIIRLGVDFVALFLDMAAVVVYLATKIMWLVEKLKDAWKWFKELLGLGPVAQATIKAPESKLANQGKNLQPKMSYVSSEGNLVSDVPSVVGYPGAPRPLKSDADAAKQLQMAQDEDARRMLALQAQVEAQRGQKNQHPTDFVKWDAVEPARAAAAAAGIAESGSLRRGEGPIDYEKLAAALESRPTIVQLSVGQEKLAQVLARGRSAQMARESSTNTYVNNED